MLRELGYTVATRVGLAYPADSEPDQLLVAALVAELTLVHNELLGYRYGTHPHPAVVEGLLPEHLRLVGWLFGCCRLGVLCGRNIYGHVRWVHRLVTACTLGEFVVLPQWENKLTVP